jgi:hypothetical protein
MSTRTSRLLLVAWLVTSTSWAANDPFVGKWKLNPSKSTFIDQVKIEAAGPNTYAITFAGGDAETVVADGTDQPGLGGSTLSLTVDRPDTWKVVRKRQGRTVITGIWKLSENGETFSDAVTANQPDGSTMSAQAVYKRTTAGSGFPGTWEMTSQMMMNSVFEFQIQPYEGDGLSFIYPSQQKTQHMKFDGKDYPDVGPNVPAGAASSGRRVNERSLEMTDKIKGKVTSNQDFTLSPDLETLTITVHVVGQGKPNILVFDRQ